MSKLLSSAAWFDPGCNYAASGNKDWKRVTPEKRRGSELTRMQTEAEGSLVSAPEQNKHRHAEISVSPPREEIAGCRMTEWQLKNGVGLRFLGQYSQAARTVGRPPCAHSTHWRGSAGLRRSLLKRQMKTKTLNDCRWPHPHSHHKHNPWFAPRPRGPWARWGRCGTLLLLQNSASIQL